MEITIVCRGQQTVGVVRSAAAVVTDTQSALDLLAETCFAYGCEKLLIEKSAIAEPFFDLRTGLLGDMLQKYTNYRVQTAIVGDFSGYASAALRDFIRESNRGTQIFFTATEQQALEALCPDEPR